MDLGPIFIHNDLLLSRYLTSHLQRPFPIRCPSQAPGTRIGACPLRVTTQATTGSFSELPLPSQKWSRPSKNLQGPLPFPEPEPPGDMPLKAPLHFCMRVPEGKGADVPVMRGGPKMRVRPATNNQGPTLALPTLPLLGPPLSAPPLPGLSHCLWGKMMNNVTAEAGACAPLHVLVNKREVPANPP